MTKDKLLLQQTLIYRQTTENFNEDVSECRPFFSTNRAEERAAAGQDAWGGEGGAEGGAEEAEGAAGGREGGQEECGLPALQAGGVP